MMYFWIEMWDPDEDSEYYLNHSRCIRFDDDGEWFGPPFRLLSVKRIL